jgi:putative Mg2+ transporter-C (MgtC) family protein
MEALPEIFDWSHVGRNALYIVIALILALPLGFDRERAEALGIRTIPLVAVAACGYVLVGIGVAQDSPDAVGRVLQGLITGVGFLGGGAILKYGGSVRGTATAASIWNTAGIGAAVACNRFEIAILLSIINLGILTALREVGERIDGGEELDDDVQNGE